MTRPEPDALLSPPQPEETTAIDRLVRTGLEVEQRVSNAVPSELDRRTRELRYREAVDQRLLRLGIGGAVFALATAWLVADVVLTLAIGWGELNGHPFRLAESVVIAFLTTSTATVIGLFLVFLRWLYPQGPVRPVDPDPDDRRPDSKALDKGLEGKGR